MGVLANTIERLENEIVHFNEERCELTRALQEITKKINYLDKVTKEALEVLELLKAREKNNGR